MVMESQGTESTGSTETASTGSESSSGGESTSQQTMPDDPKFAEGGLEAAQQAAADAQAKTPADPTKPAYTPNFKWKGMGSEGEFAEWLKPHIKDPEVEKEVRALYEKAAGLDYAKDSRQKLYEASQVMQQEIHEHRNVVQNVNQWRQNKDYGALFSFLNIPEQDLFAHVKQVLEKKELLANMTPEQRAAFERDANNSAKLYDLENQNNQLTQSYQNIAITARTQELDWTLGRPDISQVVQAYDARTGQPGSFRQAVIQRGQYHAFATGKDISPEQAIQEVLSFLGGKEALVPAQSTPAMMPGQMGKPPVVQAQPKPAVLPNIQGRGTSPAKKMVKSLADLRKRAQELATD